MKSLKNVALFAIIFAGNTFPMRMTEMGQKGAKSKVRHFLSYFIYSLETTEGIWISKKIAEENSEYIKMLSQRSNANKIGLPFSIELIKLAFNILSHPTYIKNLSLEQLINVMIVFDFLVVPSPVMKIVLNESKWNIEKNSEINSNEIVKELPAHIQKLLLMDSTVDYLKNSIIKKYVEDRKKDLVGHPDSVYSVAFSLDGTKIVSGCRDNQHNLIVWDISNPDAITHQILVGHPDSVYSVAFSHDGTKIVSGGSGNQHNLILWDISNPDVITHQDLVGHPNRVNSVAFSPDGTKIVSGCYGNQYNLILWDISNPDAITHQDLVGHPDNAASVAFSPDGTKIVSGCGGNQHNLIVWDISNPDAITYQDLVGHPDSVASVAFSPDSTKILSGCVDEQHNLIVWTLLTDQEIKLLQQLQQYNADQVRLIYSLCLQGIQGKTIQLQLESEEQKIFNTLPQDMQQLLTDLFFPKKG